MESTRATRMRRTSGISRIAPPSPRILRRGHNSIAGNAGVFVVVGAVRLLSLLQLLLLARQQVGAFLALNAHDLKRRDCYPSVFRVPSLPSRTVRVVMLQQQQRSTETEPAVEVVDRGGVVSVDPETKQVRFMLLSKEQDDELKRLGDREERLMGSVHPINEMVPTPTVLPSRGSAAKKSRGGAGGEGFGRGGATRGFGKAGQREKAEKGNESSKSRTDGQSFVPSVNSKWTDAELSYTNTLATDGLVCIENVLPNEAADQLRDYLIDLRDRSRSAIESGDITHSQDRFADVLLNQNRCDLKVPLGPAAVNDALRHLLVSKDAVLRNLIELVFEKHGCVGSLATLYELNCFMSQSGARRQLVHADIVCQSDDDRPSVLGRDEPIMLTCFVALQDVDATMGPTYFIPRTHNLEAHQQFFETPGAAMPPSSSLFESTKDELLATRPAVMGTLKKGSCILFDPRTLHCAGANFCDDPAQTRALFYFSYKNPKVDSPGCPSCGGYGIPDAEFTLQQLCDELVAEQTGDVSAFRKLAMLASNP